MIQRIQTLLLFLAFLLLGMFLIIPYAHIHGNNNLALLKVINFNQTNSSVLYYLQEVVFVAILLVELATIFLFKNRKRQMLFCLLAILGSAVLAVLMYFNAQLIAHNLSGSVVQYNLGVIILFFVILLDYFAYRRIKKDDDLVRSLDRLR
jgi:hypothetical protein